MQQVIAIIIGLGLIYLLWRQWQAAERKFQTLPLNLFSAVQDLLTDTKLEHGEAFGTWKLTGTYQGHTFHFKAVVDTLATRKLPSMWLLITLPEAQQVSAILDLMMRPTGPTSFSNFDFLPQSLQTPEGFPEHAVLRTDNLDLCLPAEILRPHLLHFEQCRGKEILISPKGLRVVVQVAEVDRLRYGVFREANFSDTVIDNNIAAQCLQILLALNEDIKRHD